MEYVCLIGIVAIVGIWIAVGRAISRQATFIYEKYKHHGDAEMWVRKDLKGLHRDFCLCYSCKRFHPGTAASCSIAQAVYRSCVLHNVVTPVWECPRFAQTPVH